MSARPRIRAATAGRGGHHGRHVSWAGLPRAEARLGPARALVFAGPPDHRRLVVRGLGPQRPGLLRLVSATRPGSSSAAATRSRRNRRPGRPARPPPARPGPQPVPAPDESPTASYPRHASTGPAAAAETGRAHESGLAPDSGARRPQPVPARGYRPSGSARSPVRAPPRPQVGQRVRLHRPAGAPPIASHSNVPGTIRSTQVRACSPDTSRVAPPSVIVHHTAPRRNMTTPSRIGATIPNAGASPDMWPMTQPARRLAIALAGAWRSEPTSAARPSNSWMTPAGAGDPPRCEGSR